MRKPELMNHKGRFVYYMDFSNLKNHEEFVTIISLSREYIRSQPEGSVYALTNMDGMHFNSSVRDMFSDFISGNKPYIKASAVFGINGLLRIIYNTLTKITGREIKSFENQSLALEWLVAR